MSEIVKSIEDKSITIDKLADLIEQGEDINSVDEDGLSPLLLACMVEDLVLARILLEHGADVDNLNQDDEEEFYREPPLTSAAESGNIEMVKLLLEYGADLYLGNEDGNTALMLAYRRHDIQMVSLLLKYKEEVDSEIADIRSIILSDEEFKNHPRVMSLLESVEIIDSAVDLSGGNADDKIEIMTLEIGDKEKIRLDYLYMYNWSYGEVHLILKSKGGKGASDVFMSNEDYEAISLESLEPLCDLAIALGLNDLTLKTFTKFIILLVSRMVQKEYLPLEEHGLYIRLNPDDEDDQDEELQTHFSHTPVGQLHF